MTENKNTKAVDVSERVSTPNLRIADTSNTSDGFPDCTYTTARDLVVGSRITNNADQKNREPWHRKRDLWDKIHNEMELTGKGIKIAILDSGVAQHADLNDAIVRKSYRNGTEAVVDYPFAWIENMHGTHVASIAAGLNGLGAAPDAQIMDYQVLFGRNGTGGNAGIAQAIRDAADDGADIVNLSLGSDGDFPIDPRTEAALAYAISKGCYVFAATGNSGFVAGRNSVDNPGKSSGSIGVAAIRSDGTIAGFSGGGEEVDIASPGENIDGAHYEGGRVSISGTSMATPDAAGVFALSLQRADRSGIPRPKTLTDVRGFLADHAKDGGAPGEDVRFGSGIPRADVMAEALTTPDVTMMSRGI